VFFTAGQMFFQPAYQRQQEISDDEADDERQDDTDKFPEYQDKYQETDDKGYQPPMFFDYDAYRTQLSPPQPSSVQ
jgi:hypothetical protein